MKLVSCKGCGVVFDEELVDFESHCDDDGEYMYDVCPVCCSDFYGTYYNADGSRVKEGK